MRVLGFVRAFGGVCLRIDFQDVRGEHRRQRDAEHHSAGDGERVGVCHRREDHARHARQREQRKERHRDDQHREKHGRADLCGG